MTTEKLQRKPHGRYFEVIIEEVDESALHAGFGIGVCLHPNTDKDLKRPVGGFEGNASEVLKHSWLIGYNARVELCGVSKYLKGAELVALPGRKKEDKAETHWTPRQLVPGDTVGVMCTPEGAMMVYVNGRIRYNREKCGVPFAKDLYAVIDLDGYIKSVHVGDTSGTLENYHVHERNRLRIEIMAKQLRPHRTEALKPASKMSVKEAERENAREKRQLVFLRWQNRQGVVGVGDVKKLNLAHKNFKIGALPPLPPSSVFEKLENNKKSILDRALDRTI